MIQVDATMCGFSGLFQNTAVSIFGDEQVDFALRKRQLSIS